MGTRHGLSISKCIKIGSKHSTFRGVYVLFFTTLVSLIMEIGLMLLFKVMITPPLQLINLAFSIWTQQHWSVFTVSFDGRILLFVIGDFELSIWDWVRSIWLPIYVLVLLTLFYKFVHFARLIDRLILYHYVI